MSVSSRRHQTSDLGARVLAAVPAIIFAIVIVELGGIGFAIGISLLGIACLHELYTMLERTRPVKLAGFVGVVAMVLAADLGGPDQVLLAAAGAVLLTFVLALAVPDLPDFNPPIAVTLLGIFWIGLALAHAMLLRDLVHGGAIVVQVLVATFVGDTAAYLGGRLLGKTLLAPKISPNKTWEGLACGVVAAIAASWFTGLYHDWQPGWQALVIGAGVAIVAPFGDLFESAVKRGAGTKDTGKLFGPHGGALDRLDAVLFTIVAGYWIWRALL